MEDLNQMSLFGDETDKRKEIEFLIDKLNEANEAYYGDGEEIMSNKEYDDMYDKLLELEKETGIILSSSPTQSVGHNIKTKLPKEEHEKPMLSLSKTKSVDELAEFIGENESMISWKMDGLTVVLTYKDGKLFKGLTRGNGTIGEVITDNVKQFKNVPLSINYKGDLTVRGEAIIKYSDFEKINERLNPEEQYKNPRNLCSGSVRQLDSKITKERNVFFYAFNLVSSEGIDFDNKKSNMMEWLKKEGFTTVDYKILKNGSELKDAIEYYKEEIKTYDVPSDGLVVGYNDIKYSQSLGITNKYPKDSIAFKWADECKETKLIDIEWSASRTGLINPVAIFEPVDLEGTTVERASVHNVSILKSLKLGIGDTIKVFKANMIIPQILENLTNSNTCKVPDVCPACGGQTEVRSVNDSEALYCINENCSAKSLKYMEHFVSRNCMNIEGISEKVIEKFVEKEFITNVLDLYRLNRFKNEIICMEGFGEKSYDNIIKSVDASKNVKFANFINALGICDVGFASSKLLAKKYTSVDDLVNASEEDIKTIDGFGDITAHNVYDYFQNEKLRETTLELSKLVTIEYPEAIDTSNSSIAGLTFVITGEVNHFANRDELKEKIESLGGKTSGSVSAKTSYLINNDINSTSSKNKDAKAKGIPIITEDEFLKLIGE